MKKRNLIIIPGLDYHKNGYRKMRSRLKDYNVYFFDYNYDKPTDEIVEGLDKFVKENKIRKSNFITHSYGSVIFRLFHRKNKKISDRVVEIAPLNKHSKILEKFHKLFPKLLDKILGEAYRDFVDKADEILEIKLPSNVGVIAGNKRFNPRRWETYFIPLFYNNVGSDGKIFVNETKDKMMKAFSVVPDTHARLITNDEVIDKINTFFKTLKFEK